MLPFVGIQLSLDWESGVNDYVLYSRHEMLLHIQMIRREVFIQIFLQLFKAQRVAVLMLPVVVSELLQTVVSQMNIIVFVRQRIVITGRPHVPFLVDVELQLVCKQSPNPQIKFPPSVQQRLFNVLLHHPEAIAWRSRKYKLLDVFNVSKYFYASALIQGCWLHQPNVLFAVLVRNSLLLAPSLVNFFKSRYELNYFVIVLIASNQKSSWSRVKHWVPFIAGLVLRLVEGFEGPYQSRFCTEASDNFKMIKNERSRILLHSFVYFVIPLESDQIFLNTLKPKFTGLHKKWHRSIASS